MSTVTGVEVEYMFYSGELHGKALGRRFKKTSADLQWRFLFSCFVSSAVP